MIFSLTFKTPDVLEPALDEVSYYHNYSCDCGGTCLECEMREEQAEKDREEIRSLAKEYLVYGEYITIIFDTKTKTATVKKAKN
jgi:hypothetical protein